MTSYAKRDLEAFVNTSCRHCTRSQTPIPSILICFNIYLFLFLNFNTVSRLAIIEDALKSNCVQWTLKFHLIFCFYKFDFKLYKVNKFHLFIFYVTGSKNILEKNFFRPPLSCQHFLYSPMICKNTGINFITLFPKLQSDIFKKKFEKTSLKKINFQFALSPVILRIFAEFSAIV